MIQLLNCNDITYEAREIPKEDLDSLKASILEKGLLHPITVSKLPSDGKFFLISGLKRLICCLELGYQKIDCNVLDGDITTESILEIHIHENLKRSNLPWYDQVELVKQLHELRLKQKGQKNAGRPKLNEEKAWSQRDTAEELGVSLGMLNQDLQLADFVVNDPSLRNIKDKQTALRLAKLAAQRIESEQFAGLRVEFEVNQIFFGESSEILKRFPDASFDACITDPPWGKYIDPELTSDEFTIKVFRELYRVMKFDSFLLAFVDTLDFFYYYNELPKFGFEVSRMPLIWEKENQITLGTKSWELARDYEPILLAVKGSPVTASSTQRSRIFKYPLVPQQHKIHPNEKPTILIDELLEYFTYSGSVVLDPFAGSGVTIESCIKNRRRYVGIERDKKFYDGIINRIKKGEK